MSRTILDKLVLRAPNKECRFQDYSHSIWVHGLAGEKLVVLEVSNDLLGKVLCALLELLDRLLVGTVLLQLVLDSLHVSLEVAEVALLVECGLIETEGVDNIDHGLCRVIGTLLGLLSGSIGTGVDIDWADGDFAAVGLVCDTVDLLQVVGVGDDLVTSDDVLRQFILVEALKMLDSENNFVF